jgi:hypothetical protein
MSIKELIKAELEYLSEDALAELYQLAKSRSHREKQEPIDEWDLIIQECQIDTGITDLAYQHDHYIHGTPKREIE